jgi:hypothetical protein
VTDDGPTSERVWFSILLTAVAVGVGVAAALYAKKTSIPYALPIWLIAGLVVLMAVLGLVVVVLKSLGLTSSDFPLGLPEGSIRAIIALGLILLFFLMSFNLFGYLKSVSMVEIPNLTQKRVDKIPIIEIAGVRPDPNNAGRFIVERITGPTQTSQDLAKQLLTTLSTLVVAIAAFYFGSSSVAQALKHGENGSSAGEPSLRITEPPTFPHTFQRSAGRLLPVKMRIRTSPSDAAIQASFESDPDGGLVRTGKGKYEYRPGSPTDDVVARLSMVDHPEVSREVRFRIPRD